GPTPPGPANRGGVLSCVWQSRQTIANLQSAAYNPHHNVHLAQARPTMSSSPLVRDRSCGSVRPFGSKPRPDPSSPPAGASAGSATGLRGFAFRKAAPVPGPRPLRRPRLVLFLCLGASLACAGCGERRAAVSGKATVDGKPLNSKLITILFAPDK